VPALRLDNSQVLTENVAILSYLSDQKGNVKGDRYQFLEWLAFISTEMHKSIGSLFGLKGGPAEVVNAVKDRIAKRLQLMDQHLNGKEYVFGDAFSALDAYLVTVLNWCPMLQVDLGPYSNIQGYLKNMYARPSIQKTLKEEGLVK
jgi:glutathione S-transferase